MPGGNGLIERLQWERWAIRLAKSASSHHSVVQGICIL